MSKVDQKVMDLAEQEAADYMSFGKDDVRDFWSEDAEEDYRSYLENLRYEELDKHDFWVDDQGYAHAVEPEEDFFEKQLRDYERENFSGKRWEDVDPMVRDVWSDLYKDVNGVRPHHIPFCCIA